MVHVDMNEIFVTWKFLAQNFVKKINTSYDS